MSRRLLTTKEKLDVLKDLEQNCAQTDLATKYNVSVSTISRIKTLECKIRAINNPDKKRDRKSWHVALEVSLHNWLLKVKSMNVRITSKDLLLKAQELALSLDKDYVPDRSWIQRWCKRNSITISNMADDDDNHVENSKDDVSQFNVANCLSIELGQPRIEPELSNGLRSKNTLLSELMRDTDKEQEEEGQSVESQLVTEIDLDAVKIEPECPTDTNLSETSSTLQSNNSKEMPTLQTLPTLTKVNLPLKRIEIKPKTPYDWKEEDILRLIAIFQQELYNKNGKFTGWRSVVNQLGILGVDMIDVKTKWDALCATYYEYLTISKENKARFGENNAPDVTWPYFKYMQFLDSNIPNAQPVIDTPTQPTVNQLPKIQVGNQLGPPRKRQRSITPTNTPSSSPAKVNKAQDQLNAATDRNSSFCNYLLMELQALNNQNARALRMSLNQTLFTFLENVKETGFED